MLSFNANGLLEVQKSLCLTAYKAFFSKIKANIKEDRKQFRKKELYENIKKESDEALMPPKCQITSKHGT